LDGSSYDEEDDNNEENDGGSAGDDTNEQITVPITDQDRRGANLGLNLALGFEEEVKVTLECPQGFTLNSKGPCERTVTGDPSCPVEGDFKYKPVTNLCEASTPPICKIGTFNPETHKCEQVQTLPPI
jgi:hypothetical protein